MKWNANNISLFLQVYQQFPALWNVKDKDYCNKSYRETLLDQLMSELEENHLLGQMDKKQLKSKIKSLKDVYRTELIKIEKSKRSGCGADDIYVPKLTWFNDASYLSEVVATRSNKSNWDLNHSQNSEQDAQEGHTTYPDEPSSVGKTTALKSMAGIMKPPEHPKKRFKKLLGNPEDKQLFLAIQKLDDIAHQCSMDKPYEQFGKYVAAELRQLPLRAAVLLQQEIQNSITHSKLNILDNGSVRQEFDNYTLDYQSPESMSSNDEDTALLNITTELHAAVNEKEKSLQLRNYYSLLCESNSTVCSRLKHDKTELESFIRDLTKECNDLKVDVEKNRFMLEKQLQKYKMMLAEQQRKANQSVYVMKLDEAKKKNISLQEEIKRLNHMEERIKYDYKKLVDETSKSLYEALVDFSSEVVTLCCKS